MKKTNTLNIGFLITFVLAVVSLFLDWVSVGFMAENGIEQGVSFLVIPFVIIAVLSLILKLEKKALFIIFGIITTIIAAGVCILLLGVKSDMGRMNGALTTGYYLMLISSFANIILGVITIISGPKKNKATS